MSKNIEEYNYTCFSSCHKCKRKIIVEYNNHHFETKENVTFLGRLGSETYTYCPYCGIKQTGFQSYDMHQEIDFSSEDDDVEELDGEDSWWPDVEGVTLIDEEDDNDSEETEDEAAKESFVCSSCGETFRLNPKGCDKIYCYYCGEHIE